MLTLYVLLMLCSTFTSLQLISCVVLIMYRDIYSNSQDLARFNMKVGNKPGTIWMPLSIVRLAFRWPVYFGNIQEIRQKKETLKQKLAAKTGKKYE